MDSESWRGRCVLRRGRWVTGVLAVVLGALTWVSVGFGQVPDIEPNESIPGTGEFGRLAGGLLTVGLIAAGVGLVVSLAGMAVAGHTHNVHLRDRFKTGAGLSLLATVGFGAANTLLDWAWGIGGGF